MIQFLNKSKGNSDGSKDFDTVEDMINSTNNQEGDVAVIYSSKLLNGQVNSIYQVISFPSVVVLDEVISTSSMLTLRAIDNSGMTNAMVELSATRFNFRFYGTSSSVSITYTSEDGVTYTRTDGGEETIDLGVSVYCYSPEQWQDSYGYFMQIDTSIFDGIFEYKCFDDETKIITHNIVLPDDVNPTISLTEGKSIVFDKIEKINKKFLEAHSKTQLMSLVLADGIDDNNELINPIAYTYDRSGFSPCAIMQLYDGTIRATSLDNATANGVMYKIIYDLENNNYTEEILEGTVIHSDSEYSWEKYWKYYEEISTEKSVAVGLRTDLSPNFVTVPNNVRIYTYSGTGTKYNQTNYMSKYDKKFLWDVAPTQLTAIKNEVFGDKIFCGKDGVETGTLGLDVSLFGDDKNAELFTMISDYYEGAQSVQLEDGFTAPKDIFYIPSKKDGSLLWNTTSLTSTLRMFQSCKNLRIVEHLDLPNVQTAKEMFYVCDSLEYVELTTSATLQNMDSMFYNNKVLKSVSISNTDMVTSMNRLFASCYELTDITGLNTSNVEDMSYMFSQCWKLNIVPNLNTVNATNMNNMFYGCKELIDAPELDTSKVTNIYNMFYSCSKLENVPVYDTSNVTNMRSMFEYCSNLTDASLNNILLMCKNATKVSSSAKTLKLLGLSTEQATKCTSLSNWSAASSSGWTVQ